MKIVDKRWCDTLLAGSGDLPTLEELLDQFEQIFGLKLLEDQRRFDNLASSNRGEPDLVGGETSPLGGKGGPALLDV